MFQKAWDPDYTTNPNHPFTRKVLEAIDEGILVLFAAGNCGGTCPDGRCGSDVGPGKSIWGANGHARVITVGAVNKNEQFVGYSSQGPAALSSDKPDFCSVTHFTGYFNSDSGTSAATPIAAGVVALLKQSKPSVTQQEIQSVLKSTAKDIGATGFDQNAGAGILRAKAAYDAVAVPPSWKGWESLGGFCTDGVGVSSWAPGRLDCFVVGNDRALWHKWYSNGWSNWESLGGKLYSNPAAVSWGPNRIDAFAIGGDHAMWHRWWDGSSWKGWESLGGFCTDGVGVSSWAPGRLDCFVVGNDRALWHKWYSNGWSNWESLGGKLYSNPAAVSWGPNRIDAFAIGGDHAMWHRWWDGSSWKGWESLGRVLHRRRGGLLVGAGPAGLLRGRERRALWHKWYSNGWSNWESLGGKLYSNPAAVSWGPTASTPSPSAATTPCGTAGGCRLTQLPVWGRALQVAVSLSALTSRTLRAGSRPGFERPSSVSEGLTIRNPPGRYSALRERWVERSGPQRSVTLSIHRLARNLHRRTGGRHPSAGLRRPLRHLRSQNHVHSRER